MSVGTMNDKIWLRYSGKVGIGPDRFGYKNEATFPRREDKKMAEPLDKDPATENHNQITCP